MDQENSIRLIQLYQTYRFLWDAKDKVHHNKMKREDAWKEMADKMQHPAAVLKAKMKTLMGSYRSERSRENKSRVTGSGSEDVYESKWFAYKYFHFLSDKDNPRETVNTETGERKEQSEIAVSTEPEVSSAATISAATVTTSHATTEQQDSEKTTFRNPSISKTHRTGVKRKAPEQDVDSKMMNEAFKVIQSSLNSSKDEYFTYALNLANELRKYDATTLAHVKRAFANILFDADMGIYSAPLPYGPAFQASIPHISPSELSTTSTTSSECMGEKSRLITSNTFPTSPNPLEFTISENTNDAMLLNL